MDVWLGISPKIICYTQQIQRCVTKILDNGVTLLTNENLFVITI